MVVKDGVLTYIGDGANIRVAATETVDLNGRFAMPVFGIEERQLKRQ